jgi:glycosyltransferase involved in cell wall biosynthesis
MRVLYFHQYFNTPDGSSGTRSYEFALALLARGHDVTMVCGTTALSGLKFPWDAERRWCRGTVNGIDVIVLPLRYSNHDGLGRRTLIFLRFAWRSALLALKGDYDLLFATSTPLTAALPGILARWVRRKPFVFEVRDLWPELPKALGMRNPFLLSGMSLLEWLAYKSCSAAVALSPGIVEGIRRRAEKDLPVTMIPNGCDLDIFRPELRQDLSLEGIAAGDFVAGFTGAHGVANGLDAVLDTAAVLLRRGQTHIKFAFIGDGREKQRLRERASHEKLLNCLFYPPMRKADLARVIASLGCGLMVLKNVPAFYYGTSPNKFFDYVAAGIPVVNNYPGWLAEMIEREKCGVVVPPGDPERFADTLQSLASDPETCRRMGTAARNLAGRQFAREKLTAQFVDWLEMHSGQISLSAAPVDHLHETRA